MRALASGEPSTLRACLNNVFLTDSHTASTAEPTEDAVAEPPWIVACGIAESPSEKLTSASGSPSVSTAMGHEPGDRCYEPRMLDPRPPISQDPSLLPFLPLLYVAWADGALEDDEQSTLRQHLEAQPALSPAAREALLAWLDPTRPPTPSTLIEWLDQLRKISSTVDPASVHTLGDLGVAIAGDAADAPTVEALRTLAGALGLTRTPLAVILPAAPAPAHTHARILDVDALRQRLDGPEAAARDDIREFLAAHRPPHDLATPALRVLCHDWLRELGERGVGRHAFPGVTTEAVDISGFVARFETLALGDLSVLIKAGVQFGLFGGSIFHLGNEAQRRRYLPLAASLELLGCFAMSETGHGSNVADLETTARYDPATQEFEIDTPGDAARKDWIGGAATHARMATVFAQLEVAGERHGVHAFLVPIRDPAGALLPGVEATDAGQKMGLNGVDNGRLWFHGVRIPRDAMLDRFATVTVDGRYESAIPSPSRRFFTMLGTLVAGRVSIASAAVSVAKVGLTIAIRYASIRRQFGPSGAPETPILDYPTHQRRLLPALATTYALHFAARALQHAYVSAASGDREVETLAAGLKAYASWHVTRTLQDCRECCGGQGYLAVNRIPALLADADIFTTFEGDNTVLMQLVARSLLTSFHRQFADARFVGLLRHLARQATTVIREKNPVVTRMTDPAHLRDREFQLAAFRYREQRLLQTAAQRMKKRMDAGADGHHVVMEVQEHLVALAHAHIERVVLEAFDAGVRATTDAPLAQWLDHLCDLHALSRLADDMSWFVEDGYVDPWKARAVRKQVSALCLEIKDAAVDLVDGFAIPDACLAPIAFAEGLS